MNSVIIKKIPVEADLEKLMKKKNFQANSPSYLEYLNAVDILNKRFQPMAILKECSVEATSGNTIIIGGYSYKSKILSHLLKDNQRVFLYLLTMGEMPSDITQIEKYFVHSLKLPVMISAMQNLKKMVQIEHHLEKIGMVNPGLIPDWPIQANQTIFETFGNATKGIGVQMTEACTMRPLYSSSGILFDDLKHYCECETCTIDACVGREARFCRTA
ncbi:hypothetical protein [Acetobacterium bakii]|uniref:Vitamin B12 dependent methionine synthase n=1 Tax=Acetobacterium bakii TaxID=52689 RepID=A0A0L6TZP5_9FIRM|nr:hypothetical protein [Acetobacterium bakii]KNZ41736.1 hypothetical protein AKG39_10275 [Acetobacterium bakii]